MRGSTGIEHLRGGDDDAALADAGFDVEAALTRHAAAIEAEEPPPEQPVM